MTTPHTARPRNPVVEVHDRAVVVRVRAELDARVAEQVRAAVDRCGHVVLDVTDVATLDPTGLGILVRAHRRARRHNGTACLAAPSRFLLTVLHTMRLDGLFPIFDDCGSALIWLRGTPASRTGTDRVEEMVA